MARSLAERFHEKVTPVPEAGYWLWTASTSRGYGQLSSKRGESPHKAHRVSWRLHRGDIPAHMDVCHKCDTPLCVNPDHMFLGTAKDNVDDMDRKGRRVNAQAKGTRHGMARLTEDEVMAIRASSDKQNVIALRFGVHKALVSLIKRGKVWKHIMEPRQ